MFHHHADETPEKRVENTTRSEIFLTNFEVFHLSGGSRGRVQGVRKHSLNINFYCIFFMNY